MKPKLVKELEVTRKPRGDGRMRTWHRDLYECPLCQKHYEACRLVVNNGYSQTCGCEEPSKKASSIDGRTSRNLNISPWFRDKDYSPRVSLVRPQPTLVSLPLGKKY